MSKMRSTHTRNIIQPSKGREVILSHATAWMNHEDTLHDVSPSPKDKSCGRPLVSHQIHRDGKRNTACRGGFYECSLMRCSLVGAGAGGGGGRRDGESVFD